MTRRQRARPAVPPLRRPALAALALLLWGPAAAQPAAEVRRITFGLLPFASPGALFKRFAPLRAYLEDRTGLAVRLKTAPDFLTFVRRTGRGRYDVVLTAPHFTLLALDSGHYRVGATYLEPLSGVIVTRRESGQDPPGTGDCREVATPPPSAVITLLGKRYLSGVPGARPRFRYHASHNAALRAVLGGDACAGVVSINVWHRLRREVEGLRAVAKTAEIPAMGILLHRDLPAALRRRITRTLVRMKERPGGRKALRRMAYPGYRPADAGTFAPVRPYLEELPPGWPETGETP